MKRKKQIKKAVKVLTKLRNDGVELSHHCGNGCWRVTLEGQFASFACVSDDGEVYL